MNVYIYIHIYMYACMHACVPVCVETLYIYIYIVCEEAFTLQIGGAMFGVSGHMGARWDCFYLSRACILSWHLSRKRKPFFHQGWTSSSNPWYFRGGLPASIASISKAREIGGVGGLQHVSKEQPEEQYRSQEIAPASLRLKSGNVST